MMIIRLILKVQSALLISAIFNNLKPVWQVLVHGIIKSQIYWPKEYVSLVQNASVAQDLEPEYITISADSKTAWVTLQENNAIARIDIAQQKVTDIYPLGYKEHSLVENALDVSDRSCDPKTDCNGDGVIDTKDKDKE